MKNVRRIIAGGAVFGAGWAAAFAATPGYVEDFVGAGNLGGFSGGSSAYENPGTGGVGGVDDGFLLVRNDSPNNFGAADFAGNFSGNWIANGVTGISFWLNDINNQDNPEIHFGLGIPFVNFWQYNPGFTPGHNEWTQFTIDLSNPDESQWTRIIGDGSLVDALSDVQRILFRHDTAPFIQFPDLFEGEVGIDRILLIPSPGAAALLLLGLGAGAGRRR
ncbi:MAG: hypothetical protein EA379_05940 [Phycisphaerales bacterium]|nr:MAG: hypothetical protein EA379_05940 [Phycisphaerales bacterium]